MPVTAPVDRAIDRLVAGEHANPHEVLGRHGDVVRAWRPGAQSLRVVASDGTSMAAEKINAAGVFEAQWPEDVDYHFEAEYASARYAYEDPYRFWPTLGDLDLHLFGEGAHRTLWKAMGAHHRIHQGVLGVAFAVWAPTARAVRVVGDFNHWDGRVHPMRSLGSSGVWELFVPAVALGDRYKFEILTQDRRLILKADPFAFQAEPPPGTASIVSRPSTHTWRDDEWQAERDASAADHLHRPLSIYEVHLGSWRHGVDLDGEPRPLTYRELAEQLPAYVSEMGFTHVEFLPVAEHPFGGSWGYQVSSYYAPTSRFGSPDDFRFLVDALHCAGIGVIVDWVPAHFPKDDWALARFDGTALFEHADPRLGEHPDWGTLVFNFGRNEVRNFLVANALYWLDEFHVDGLRVDAVASMLYLDYSRQPGQWIPNKFGGRENLDAIEFLKELNCVVYAEHPGAMMIAEESTSWPAVSRPVHLGGLGFGFKWNMGWMHDTLSYFEHEPIHRRWHHNNLTFGLLYAWSEHFVLPLSHDEVVHLKKALLAKMPGDWWQQMANLRALYAWMWAHPGKQLLFMGGEFGQWTEWNHDRSLDWHLLEGEGPGPDAHRGLQRMLRDANHLSKQLNAFWETDTDPNGFQWIDANDAEDNVLSFLRSPSSPGAPPVACIANLSPMVRQGFRVGVPFAGRWAEVMNTDAAEYGGSGVGNGGDVWAVDEPSHGFPASVEVTLPPLGVLWLAHGG